MIARLCPNCKCIKEVSELKQEGEVICVCLTCGKSFSFTEENVCKFKYKFGKDCDCFLECFECNRDIWEKCRSKQEGMKNALKKNRSI